MMIPGAGASTVGVARTGGTSVVIYGGSVTTVIDLPDIGRARALAAFEENKRAAPAFFPKPEPEYLRTNPDSY